MRSQPAARFHVVKKQEKEGRLTEFIRQQLAGGNGDGLAREFLLVARSPRSPAMRALRALAGELLREAIGIRAVLLEAAEADLTSEAPLGEIRLLSEVRALEAHEQLVLGPATAWIGDCMRREPNERDAFEAYATACPLTAGWALRSFQALWRRATPVSIVHAGAAERVAAELAAGALPGGIENAPAGPSPRS